MTILERLLKVEKQMNIIYCKINDGGLEQPVVSSHNELEGLDGGDENGYFHLTQEQIDGLNEGLNGGFNPLTTEFSVTKGAGRFDSGELFPGGKTLSQAFQMLLTDTYTPTYTNPTFSVTTNIQNREVGEVVNLEIGLLFNCGLILGKKIDNFWDFNATQNQRSGNPIQYKINDDEILTQNLSITKSILDYVIPYETQNFACSITYARGPQPLDSEGNMVGVKLPTGTLSTNVNIVGHLRRYSGSIDVKPTSGEELRTNLIDKSVLNTSNSFSFSTGTVNRIFVIAIPNSKNIRTVVNSYTNENLTSGFTLSTINAVPDASGVLRPYKVYIMENAVPFSNDYVINVTLY